jgi:hypothetical protein
MKKHFILFSFLCCLAWVNFNSCKSTPTPSETITAPVQEVTPPATTVTEKAADVVGAIAVPTFENADVNQFCQDFKTLMGEYAGLKGTGDAVKEAELEKKFNDWANRAGELAGKIKPEELQQFNDFIGQAQTHFARMKTATAQ